MPTETIGSAICQGCGAVVPEIDGGVHPYMLSAPGCWDVYSKVLAREYRHRDYFAAHRCTVDSYAAQHPGMPERRSIQSVNAHLVGLHLTLERAVAAPFAARLIGVIADRLNRDLAWLPPPPSLGDVTVVDMLGAETADAHCRRALRWARSVWQAWTPHHAAVRALAERAIGIL